MKALAAAVFLAASVALADDLPDAGTIIRMDKPSVISMDTFMAPLPPGYFMDDQEYALINSKLWELHNNQENYRIWLWVASSLVTVLSGLAGVLIPLYLQKGKP